MKNTLKINQILETIEETKRKEVIEIYDECMKAICCENIDWQAFEIFTTSQEILKNMLLALSPEHIMAVTDIINQRDGQKAIVKIALQVKDKEEIFTVKQSSDTFIVSVQITNKHNKILEEKAKAVNI